MKTETISTTSIGTASIDNWKKSYKRCPHCGSHNTEVNTGYVLTTYPCQYSYYCKNCDKYFTSSDLSWIAEDHVHLETPIAQPYTPSYPTGWVCPKCGAVMSPTQNTCVYCTPAYAPIITYGVGGSISGTVDPNITIKGTISNEGNTEAVLTLDEDYFKELSKHNNNNNRQGKKE